MPRMLSDPSHANVSSLFTSNDLCFCAPALARKRPLHVLSPASLCFGAWGARRCYIRTTLNLQKRKRPIALPETLMEQMWTVGTNNRYRKSSRSRNTLASQGFLKPGGTTAATKAFSWWTKRISDADEMVMLEYVTEIFAFCTTWFRPDIDMKTFYCGDDVNTWLISSKRHSRDLEWLSTSRCGDWRSYKQYTNSRYCAGDCKKKST